MYGPAVRCKRFSSSCRFAVLHQCIRPLIGAFAPGHHGYQRACVLISGQASIGPFGSPVFAFAGKTELHLVSSSRRPRLETVDRGYVIACSSYRSVPLFEPRVRSFVPARRTSIASRAGAVKAGRRAWLAAGSGVARLRLDRAEHGARIKRSPVEICLGTSPSQAPKSRPLENTSPVPIAATMALEMIGPMPGTVIRREHA